jgi:hypothetical protein
VHATIEELICVKDEVRSTGEKKGRIVEVLNPKPSHTGNAAVNGMACSAIGRCWRLGIAVAGAY